MMDAGNADQVGSINHGIPQELKAENTESDSDTVKTAYGAMSYIKAAEAETNLLSSSMNGMY